MRIKRFVQPPLETNCYVVFDEKAGQAVMIDPASGDACGFVREKGLELKAIVLTHGHYDHIAGVPDVKRIFPEAEVIISEEDAECLTDPNRNLSAAFGMPADVGPADRTISDGDEITCGDVTLRAVSTPGHTPGGISFAVTEKGEDECLNLVSGDVLFCLGVGRTDLPGGDQQVLLNSIRKLLHAFSPETTVSPGHGPRTTLKNETARNPFLK